MNAFLWTATALLAGLALPGAVCLRAGTMSRLVALQASGSTAAVVLLLVAEGSHRPVYFDVAIAASVLSFAASLVFARFLEHWT